MLPDKQEKVLDREDSQIKSKQVSKETLTVTQTSGIDRLNIDTQGDSDTIVLDVEQTTVKPDEDQFLEFDKAGNATLISEEQIVDNVHTQSLRLDDTSHGAGTTDDMDMSNILASLTKEHELQKQNVEVTKEVTSSFPKTAEFVDKDNQVRQEKSMPAKVQDLGSLKKSKTEKTSKKKEPKSSERNIKESVASSKSTKDTVDITDVLDSATVLDISGKSVLPSVSDTRIPSKQINKETLTVTQTLDANRLDLDRLDQGSFKPENIFTIVLDVEQPPVKPCIDQLLEQDVDVTTASSQHINESMDQKDQERPKTATSATVEISSFSKKSKTVKSRKKKEAVDSEPNIKEAMTRQPDTKDTADTLEQDTLWTESAPDLEPDLKRTGNTDNTSLQVQCTNIVC